MDGLVHSLRYYPDIVQGSDEWLAARCGVLTASEMKLIITPTLKVANNDKEKAHLYEMLSQRVTGYVEPSYVSDDMLRGHDDEIDARALYSQHYEPVQEVGFVTNSRWGFTIGCSPDGLVGSDGMIEIKSRRQKFQVETIADYAPFGVIPPEYLLQVQTALLVTERKWCDFISYCGGLPMVTIRVEPDLKVQTAILEAARAFEDRLAVKLDLYRAAAKGNRTIPTERRIEQEIFI